VNSLLQFIGSVNKYEPNTRLVVYDLGLTLEQRKTVQAKILNGSMEYFPFEKFPSFFNIKQNAGEYAWKPAIIALEMDKSTAPVCWMDAGCLLTGRLRRIRSELSRVGFYSPKSSGVISDWTHPKMLEYLGLPHDWCGGFKNFAGGCVAFNPAYEKAMALAQDWAQLAQIKSCIAPNGSDRSNHRQDQALLTVLAYRSKLVTKPSKRSRYKFHQDID